ATAQGKLLAAYLPVQEQRRRLSGAALAPCTPHTVTSPEQLLEDLRQVRAQGYAVEDGEYKIGLRAVAAPVTDASGEVRYALGVMGLFRRVQSEEFRNALRQTLACARQLSAALSGAL
ncbi:MAG: IclR family transcriptional regulator C-terminal domain-containing protein, partial [Oscillospiraceae bacterium]|nr:IclR family transcriptional regulator C-terminal domain-containing protein [Oscillospiraceae bacterium]